MSHKTISLDECLRLAYQHPGVVVGPTATSHTNTRREMTDLVAKLFRRHSETDFPDHYTAVDAMRHHSPAEVHLVGPALQGYLQNLSASAGIHHLVQGRWGLVVSLTADLLLEDALRTRLDGKASSWTLTLIDHPSVTPSGQTMPVYKLLGNYRDSRIGHSLALGTSDLLIRRQTWRTLLQTLPDYLRDAPLLFIGTETIIPIVRDFLTEIYGLRPPFPSRIVYLKGDGTFQDPTIRAIVSQYSELVEVDATLRDFCEGTATIQPERLAAAATLRHASREADSGLSQIASEFSSIIDIVPRALVEGFDISGNRLRLIDALFRPTAVDWTPFLANFDLLRDDAARVVEAVRLKVAYLDKQHHPIIVLRGEAGTGKSTTAKRAAVTLAESDDVVIWCKRSPLFGGTSYRKLAQSLQKWLKASPPKRKSIIVFCDDPWGLRLSPSEVISAFEEAGLSAVFVFVARNSDFVVQEGAQQAIPSIPDETIDLSFQLSADELSRLSMFLVQVGAALDESDAKEAISRLPSRNADDILCSLWYLLPRTRASLSGAIQDEYCRLGGVTGVIQGHAAAVIDIGTQARMAYECVAVMSRLDIGLPLEVMVRAAGMNYSEWREVSKDGKPLWGLLYDVMDEQTSNINFFTRNEIVTRVLVELINGGIGHAGEFRILKHIVSACSIGTLPFRSALVDILVRGRRKLEKILTFEQGAELYEIALTTFPAQDRALRHHSGLWIRDMGRDPTRAYEEYQKAINTEDYKYSQKSEPVELIHTSMAAAIVENVVAGRQDRGTGLDMVREHLRQASNPRFFNPYSAHVFANLLFKLSQQGSLVGEEANVSLESVTDALHTIERMLQIIGSEGRKRVEHARNIQMLSDLQARILDSVVDLESLKQHAEGLLSASGQQTACEVVGRKMLQHACATSKGSDFKDVAEYVSHVDQSVRSRGQDLTVGMRVLRVDLVIRWRLHKTRGPVGWIEFRDDLEKVLASSRHRDDFIKLYYYAVALYHCNEVTKGNVVFEKMRTQIRPNGEVSRSLRNFFLGPEGLPKRLQGTLRSHHGRCSVYCPDLSADVFCKRPPSGLGQDATVHFYVAFSMYGPNAVFELPQPNQLLLP